MYSSVSWRDGTIFGVPALPVREGQWFWRQLSLVIAENIAQDLMYWVKRSQETLLPSQFVKLLCGKLSFPLNPVSTPRWCVAEFLYFLSKVLKCIFLFYRVGCNSFDIFNERKHPFRVSVILLRFYLSLILWCLFHTDLLWNELLEENDSLQLEVKIIFFSVFFPLHVVSNDFTKGGLCEGHVSKNGATALYSQGAKVSKCAPNE